MATIKLTPLFIRRFPDPINRNLNGNNYDIEHVIAICNAKDVPNNIPKEPNPRDQKTDRTIYKRVKESLLAEDDPTFLLKNKGITIIARKVIISDDKKEIDLIFSDQDGIVDGGHTYEIIQENKTDTPDNQFVKIEIITGLPDYLVEPIAEGLNTAVQVQQMSLSNLEGKFEWIKETLKDKPYYEHLAFKENQEGKFDARDIVAFMTLFNVDLYPEMTPDHPKVAYTTKAKCLLDYLDEKKSASFLKFKPILDDILNLHDYIQIHSHDLYNRKFKGKGRSLAFYKSRKRGKYSFVFMNEEGKFQLYDGALYPIMAALRFLVEQKPDSSEYSWKLGSFKKVLKFYDTVGGDLINITKNTSDSKGKNPNAIGKDDNHWAYLYQTVAYAFMKQQGK